MHVEQTRKKSAEKPLLKEHVIGKKDETPNLSQ